MLTEISLSIPASDLSPAERAQLLVPTLSALSDENRLTILLTLAETSMTNRQLHEATGMSQALVSHHLAGNPEGHSVVSTTRGVEFRSLQETPAPHPPGAEKCSTSSCPAEFECDLIRERRHAGLEAAWARGRTGSRPPLLSGDNLRTARENPRADQLLPLNPRGGV